MPVAASPTKLLRAVPRRAAADKTTIVCLPPPAQMVESTLHPERKDNESFLQKHFSPVRTDRWSRLDTGGSGDGADLHKSAFFYWRSLSERRLNSVGHYLVWNDHGRRKYGLRSGFQSQHQWHGLYDIAYF